MSFTVVLNRGKKPIAYRYWRIYVTATQSSTTSDYAEISELEMFTEIGGADVTTGGTPIASSSFGASVAANAFDGLKTSGLVWTSGNTTLPHWLGYDFGAGNDKVIVAVGISILSSTGRAPRNFQIQGSSDGVTWNSVSWEVTDQYDWTSTITRTYYKPVAATEIRRKWRINITSPVQAGNYAQIAELTFKENGVTPTARGFVIGSGFFGTAWPSYAFNSVTTGTNWISPDTTMPHWIGYDYGRNTKIDSVTITATDANRAPKDFNLQYSNDGITWTTEWSITGVSDWTTTTKTFFLKDPYDVVLLAGLTGVDGATTFTDESSYAWALTRNGNAQVSSAQTLFSRNTGLFDGTGDYITVPHSTLFSVANTTDKTIEAWFRITTANRINTIINKRSASSAQEFNFCITDTNLVQMSCFASGSAIMTITGTTRITTEVWYHAAVVRTTGGVWTLYINGLSEGTATESATPTSNTSTLTIGRDNFNTARDFLGHIAEVRYTNAARYTGAFSVPTGPFPRGNN